MANVVRPRDGGGRCTLAWGCRRIDSKALVGGKELLNGGKYRYGVSARFAGSGKSGPMRRRGTDVVAQWV